MSSRISLDQIYSSAQSRVVDAREREMNTNEKALTLKQLARPSEDPGGWEIARDLKDDVSKRDDLMRNASMGKYTLAASENVLSQMQEQLQRAHELAVSASNSDRATGQDTRAQILDEAKGILESTFQICNTTYGGRTLLSGLKSQSPAFDETGNFMGDPRAMEVEVEPGVKVPIGVTGDHAILGVGIKGGVNIIDTLRKLCAGLGADDAEAVRGTLEDLQHANNQISSVRAEIGGHMHQIERSVGGQNDDNISSKDAISRIEDADAVRVFSDLAKDQAVLRSSVSVTEKILSSNPADILFK